MCFDEELCPFILRIETDVNIPICLCEITYSYLRHVVNECTDEVWRQAIARMAALRCRGRTICKP